MTATSRHRRPWRTPRAPRPEPAVDRTAGRGRRGERRAGRGLRGQPRSARGAATRHRSPDRPSRRTTTRGRSGLCPRPPRPRCRSHRRSRSAAPHRPVPRRRDDAVRPALAVERRRRFARRRSARSPPRPGSHAARGGPPRRGPHAEQAAFRIGLRFDLDALRVGAGCQGRAFGGAVELEHLAGILTGDDPLQLDRARARGRRRSS